MDRRSNFLSLILMDALEDQNESAIKKILQRYNIDASLIPMDRGISPLHFACGMDNVELAVEVVKQFLENGANPNVKGAEGITPLHVAAIYGRVEIVKMLLAYDAKVDDYDDERKTPVHYAIEDCHFEVVQLMRDHIYRDKCKLKQSIKEEPRNQQTDHAINMQKVYNNRQCSTPKRDKQILLGDESQVNKNNLTVPNGNIGNNGTSTPNRIYYNYDTTSPYYINITHRRHRPQPMFPTNDTPTLDTGNTTSPMESSTDATTEAVNIFTLTKENLDEYSQLVSDKERSRISMIATWREKVQRSRQRQSILEQFDNIEEMLESVMQNDHLNFTNTELKEAKSLSRADEDMDSGTCASSGSCSSLLAKRGITNMSLGTVIQKIAQAHLGDDLEQEQFAPPETDCSYHTVQDKQYQLEPPKTINENDTTYRVRSPKSDAHFLQMTEAYVHTDDENGLVFYEMKLLSNQGIQQSSNSSTPNELQNNSASAPLNATVTTESTNITIPLDYETDALRAELTTFGLPPGPITKSTKSLYIRRLVKYKRKTGNRIPQKNDAKEFSFELYRTVRSEELFQNIAGYMKYEVDSMQFFANHQEKKQLREGHLKQSFIYMLIDPRISLNLPGEIGFLDKFTMWKRFLSSIFYVGKGKTSRPYSHLYDAMRTHSRMHNIQLSNEAQSNGKKISIKKQTLNLDLFKSPPPQASHSKKIDRILDIWSTENGVVCLHIFHNIVPTEAYTREAAIIDALSLHHLTNVKRGDYYGPAKTWTMREKKLLGIALLYKAMQIYLAEGESQLSPSDLL